MERVSRHAGDVFHRAVAELVALVVPPACVACGAPVDDAEETVCAACRRGLVWLPAERCSRCALPTPCDPCPASDAAFDRAWSPVVYDGAARDLIAALKFRGRFAVADAMAAQIVAGAPAGLLDGGVSLVPVPTHRASIRRRGYDQAALLAAAVARRTGRPTQPVLRRRGPAVRQLGAGRDERLRAGRIPLAVRGPVPARVVVIDDVHTTGATLDACARTLRGAGAREVAAVTWARTLAR
jgi:ComF family protein